ncbi:armadillo-type protein [Yarrowia lipolytica]|uniref:Armadillo-type protein n=1 Tax=Yarrowia lipolytica TaxID=4952 RepID=A0A371CB88_YARLL|nr:N-terminal kinase-like protein [Yarrowia lipolytica]RDW27556.1 armadillo-type protein [Yarrowia lipolytica]RDW32157.1 armadillo-type protein [Yarrowia lipolytica]RDW42219.1 armadillo-type protein [Yarrowia lipolytica]RDW44495.1 armadillo-type protein [Yarrowia lipolytica]
MDFLTKAIGTVSSYGSKLPFVLGDATQKASEGRSLWTVYDATLKSNSSDCTVFEFVADQTYPRDRIVVVKHFARSLKTYRFPGILKVHDTVETDTSVHVVTERCRSLAQVIRDSKDELSADRILWGLYFVTETLKQINAEGASTHGNISLDSIFITASGEWKVGGLELITAQKDAQSALASFGPLLPNSSNNAPPEIKNQGYQSAQSAASKLAIDSWQFGNLLQSLYTAVGVDMPAGMPAMVSQMTSVKPEKRPRIPKFLEQAQVSFFGDHDMISVSQDISQFHIISEPMERRHVLETLTKFRQAFPPAYLASSVIPELLRALTPPTPSSSQINLSNDPGVFQSDSERPQILVCILALAEGLSSKDYATLVIPTIAKMYTCPDRPIRMALLEALPSYAPHVSEKVASDQIFPQFITGFSDTSPLIRESTVKAVLPLIPHLNSRIKNNDLLRYLAKTHNDKEPGIRTNTTVILGKIADELSSSARTGILVTAFGRALKDPFVHTRNAALLALASNMDIFDASSIVNKVLPAIAPSLIDNDPAIRAQAKLTFDEFLAEVVKHTYNLDDDTEITEPPQSSVTLLATKQKEKDASKTEAGSAWSLSWSSPFTFGTKTQSTSSSTAGTPVVAQGTISRQESPAPIVDEVDSLASAARTMSIKPKSGLSLGSTKPKLAASGLGIKSTLATKKPAAPPTLQDNDGWGLDDNWDDGSDGEVVIKEAPKTKPAAKTKKPAKLDLDDDEDGDDDGWDNW